MHQDRCMNVILFHDMLSNATSGSQVQFSPPQLVHKSCVSFCSCNSNIKPNKGVSTMQFPPPKYSIQLVSHKNHACLVTLAIQTYNKGGNTMQFFPKLLLTSAHICISFHPGNSSIQHKKGGS